MLALAGLAMALASCSGRSSDVGSKEQAAQYGETLGTELTGSSPPYLQAWAHHVGMLVPEHRLDASCGPSECGAGICDGAERKLGTCTAFQIGPDLWATAGHCILPGAWDEDARWRTPEMGGTEARANSLAYKEKGCKSLALVRDYQAADSSVDEDGNLVLNTPAERVLHCKEVVAHGPLLPGSADLAASRALTLPVAEPCTQAEFEDDLENAPHSPTRCQLAVDWQGNAGGYQRFREEFTQACSASDKPWPFCEHVAIEQDGLRQLSTLDYAVFRVEERDPEAGIYAPLMFGGFERSASNTPPEPATIIGYPAGMAGRYAHGEVRSLEATLDGYATHTVLGRYDAIGGNSGSPLFLERSGLVAGLVYGAPSRDDSGRRVMSSEDNGEGGTCVRVTPCAELDDPDGNPQCRGNAKALHLGDILLSAAPEAGLAHQPFEESIVNMFGMSFGRQLDILPVGAPDGKPEAVVLTYRWDGIHLYVSLNDAPQSRLVPGRNLHHVTVFPYEGSLSPGQIGNQTSLIAGHFKTPRPAYGPREMWGTNGDYLVVSGGSATALVSEQLEEAAAFISEDAGGNFPETEADAAELDNLVEPTDVAGDFEGDYVGLRRVNVGPNPNYDDIVAFKQDGTFDVYCGGASTQSGLQLCTPVRDFQPTLLSVGFADASGDEIQEHYALHAPDGVKGGEIWLRQRFSECPDASCLWRSDDDLILPGINSSRMNTPDFPAKIEGGNFDGSVRQRPDLAVDSTEMPEIETEDIAVLAAGYVLYYSSNQWAAVVYEFPPVVDGAGVPSERPIDIETRDGNGDEYDDLLVTFQGSEGTRQRIYWGSAMGLDRDDYTDLSSTATEHVMILLDQSGSMTANDMWDGAVNAAGEWVQDASPASGGTSIVPRAYSVWTFHQYQEQDGIRQVWPPVGDSSCSALDDTTGECVLQTRADYIALQEALDEIRKSYRPSVAPLTPLAQSMCEALDWLSTLPGHRTIILQSDGGENASDSMSDCFGERLNDWGEFGEPEVPADWENFPASWQRNVLRRAVHLSKDSSVSVTLEIPDGASPFPADLDWIVDLHFETTFPTIAPATFAFARAMPRQGEWVDSSDPLLSPFAAVPLILAAAPEPSIPEFELSFFRTLGSATAGSSYREFIRTENPPEYGVDRTHPGDVDDGGCVDQADLSMMLQHDVWMRQAVPPRELATRADLTRDGWVNYDDLAALLAEWGSGCQNPPAAPDLQGRQSPTVLGCDDGLQNGSESDVDCGGNCAACPDGSACVSGADCQGGMCDLGICAEPPRFDPCECRPEKCNDCTNQLAACEAVDGCIALLHCTKEYSCTFPHEECVMGTSCNALTGVQQSSDAGQRANNLLSCMGGC